MNRSMLLMLIVPSSIFAHSFTIKAKATVLPSLSLPQITAIDDKSNAKSVKTKTPVTIVRKNHKTIITCQA